MKCKYDRATEDYIRADGEPCRTDDYGDPTKHCTARRTCSVHIGRDELTCPRCIGRTRSDLAWIVNLSALMTTAAISGGVNSEAANLAGPAADPEAWSWRKVAAKQGRSWHVSLIEDDDEHHPYLVLGRWDLMLREDYGQPSDEPVTIANAAGYLGRILHVIANDPGQDWRLFREEIRACRDRMESAIGNGAQIERGVPCPECVAAEVGAERLVRRYGHWCEEETCERMHYADDQEDRWVCPRNPEHWWTHAAYENRLEERRGA